MIDQVFADETGGNGALWYLSDTQNTVRDVAKYGSTTAGTQATVRNHLEYNTFGIVTTADDPTTVTVNDGDRPGLEGTGNEFSPQRSYTGREPDTATGLIYYRARWFDPRIGRFISEDPIGFAAGDANLSRYVGNSAPNAVDPSGLFGDYSQNFLDTLSPEMRSQVESLLGSLPQGSKPQFHHTYQHAVEEWADSRGVDVDSGQHIRMVDVELHKRISAEQIRFWTQMRTSLNVQGKSIEDVIDAAKRAGLDDWLWDRMQDFNAALDKNFSDLWLRPGFTDDDLSALKSRLCLPADVPFQNLYGSKARAKIGELIGEKGKQLWKDIVDGFDAVDGTPRTGWRTLSVPGVDVNKLLDRMDKIFTLISLTIIMTELNRMSGSNDPDIQILVSDYERAISSLEGPAGHVDPNVISRITDRLDSVLERLQSSDYHRYITSLGLVLEEGANR